MSLMPHQLAALERLRETKGCQLLSLVPGAGKTLTAITYLKEIGAKNALILAPASVVSVWSDECEKWSAPKPKQLTGSVLKRKEVLKETDGWLVCGYEMFLREYKNLTSIKWDAMVLDESHRTKSPTAKVSKAVRAFAQRVPVRLLLTGTPLKNGWGDLWSQVETIKPGSMFGNWWAFRNAFAVMPIPNIPVIKSWRNIEQIQKMLKPHVFTIDKEEIQRNLPPMTMTDIHVELSPAEKKQYALIRDEMMLDEDTTIVNALAQLTKLRQCANGLFTFGGTESSKADAIAELLETLQGEKVIIFTEYATFATYLGVRFSCPVIQGSVATDKRQEIIDTWKKSGTLLVGTSALATGLNLQDAHYIIQADLCWSKAEEEQRVGRAWRTGQKSPVTVYNLMAEGTVDWMIRKAIKTKGSMMAQLAESTLKEII